MNIIVTTKNGTTASGKVTYLGSHTIAFDAKGLTANEADELAKEGADISQLFLAWHVQIPRRTIEKYELVD